MDNKAGATAPQINEVAPAELAGRDTIARFQAQFRAAAFACLEILSGKSIDRVYCDFQDDYVCRDSTSGAPVYHFCQVKTKEKKNHLWKKPEIFGIPKRQKPNIEDIASSFAGKLMLHTVRFKTACGSVVFLTNVQLDDELEGVATALKDGDFANSVLKCYMEKFNEAFSKGEPLDEDTVRANISKLHLRPGIPYLHPDCSGQDPTGHSVAVNRLLRRLVSP